ncbi:hypothetical protein [Demequina litorisediminis]|uniref:Uncharacterized protein n=1 Tax=Demequina litorisediminis TaxID=1849022 RepID=A0ABQ6IG34_9MICO|nr:hypothetical protein [Demequina litorisediminis]GMA36121.1 hypothetical protein GCM10025876_23250 [Demequina litorisediminis]
MEDTDLAVRLDAAEAVVRHEFTQFDRVENEGDGPRAKTIGPPSGRSVSASF